MSRILMTGLVLGLATVASAANLVNNGTFDAGLTGWTATGGVGVESGNPYGLPTSPSGGDAVGVISSWGGDWNAPLGSISQSVVLSGDGTLSGELYAGTRGPDTWRNAGVEVLWNGSVVAAQWQNGDSTKWADGFPWVTFSVPVVGTGTNTLQVNYTVHFAEWTWTSADNLQLTPEPASVLLLGLGLPLLRRRR